MHVLPGNYDEEIKEEPPSQQQQEIKHPQTQGAVIVAHVRLNGDSRHYGHDMEEKDYIADKGIRRFVSEEDLKVAPQCLRTEPQSHAEPK